MMMLMMLFKRKCHQSLAYCIAMECLFIG